MCVGEYLSPEIVIRCEQIACVAVILFVASGRDFKGSIKAVMYSAPSHDRSGEALIMNDQDVVPDTELHCIDARSGVLSFGQ